MDKFTFKPLDFSDLALMHVWFNKPHVERWYSKRKWTYVQLENKLTPYITGQNHIRGFVVMYNKKPLGYIQYYPAYRFLKKDYGLKQRIHKTAGIDLFIGEEAFLGKGISKKMLLSFLYEIVRKEYLYCIVDPDVENEVALNFYTSCGFKFIAKFNSLEGTENALYVKSLFRKPVDQSWYHAHEDHASDKAKLVLKNICYS